RGPQGGLGRELRKALEIVFENGTLAVAPADLQVAFDEPLEGQDPHRVVGRRQERVQRGRLPFLAGRFKPRYHVLDELPVRGVQLSNIARGLHAYGSNGCAQTAPWLRGGAGRVMVARCERAAKQTPGAGLHQAASASSSLAEPFERLQLE